jgi:hypothetical protein
MVEFRGIKSLSGTDYVITGERSYPKVYLKLNLKKDDSSYHTFSGPKG